MHFPPGSKYEQNRDPAHGAEDWSAVSRIYLEGIATEHATFQTTSRPPPPGRRILRGMLPTQKNADWYSGRRRDRRVDGVAPGGPALVHRGVAEVSIYVGEQFRGHGLGYHLLTELCHQAEKAGYWTLQSTVLQDNAASRALHAKCGFRLVGRRERIARDCRGHWLDTYLMERRAAADEPEGFKKL